MSEDFLSCQLSQELVVIDLAGQLFIIAFDQCLQLLIRNVKRMPGEKLSQIVLVDKTVVARIDQFKCLVRRERVLLLSEETELLCLNLILQVRGPCLQEQLSRLRVEYLLLGYQGLRIHGHRSLLGEQTCMERVLWQECLAELRVAQLSIVILIKTSHEK